jgi:hypothetical protein
MTFYLPNPRVRETGWEVDEFIDVALSTSRGSASRESSEHLVSVPRCPGALFEHDAGDSTRDTM